MRWPLMWKSTHERIHANLQAENDRLVHQKTLLNDRNAELQARLDIADNNDFRNAKGQYTKAPK